MFRNKSLRGNLETTLLKKIVDTKGYTMNLTELERAIGLKPQTLRPCLTANKCNMVFANLAKIESYLYDFFNIGIDYSQPKPDFEAIAAENVTVK